MRKITNWMIALGMLLFFSGALIALTAVWKNIPSSFDIVDTQGKEDVSLSIMAPISSLGGSKISKLAPEAIPMAIPKENYAPTSLRTPREIPGATQAPTPMVISDENYAPTSAGKPSEILIATPAVTPTVISDGNNPPTGSSTPNDILNMPPAATPTIIPDENYPQTGSSTPSGNLNMPPAATPAINPAESHPSASIPVYHPIGQIPDRLVISRINLDVPVIPVGLKAIESEGQVFYQWLTPDQYAVGWHASSALLGTPGNTVFNGHHNAYGMPFKDLVKLEIGDSISLYAGSQEFRYQVVANMLLPERFEPLATRIANARWIEPTTDERVTLVSCSPQDSNTMRVIIVALPVK